MSCGVTHKERTKPYDKRDHQAGERKANGRKSYKAHALFGK